MIMYPHKLENLTDKQLFDLRDELEQSVSQLCQKKRDHKLETIILEDMERLTEVDKEIERRDEIVDYDKAMETFARDKELGIEEEYCCNQCYQIDKGEFKVGGSE